MSTTDRINDPNKILDLRQLIASGNKADRDLAEHLLKKVYPSLYQPCFPNPDQQETLEQYHQRLFEPQQPKPQPITHFLVAGENLRVLGQDQTHGFLIFEFYRHSNCVLFAYLGVALTKREDKWSTDLLTFAKRIIQRDYKSVDAIFAEIRIPNSIGGNDSKRDTERLEIMRRLGAFRVPIRYVQPALQPGLLPDTHLMLVTFATNPDRIPSPHCRVLEKYLIEFYSALGVSNPKSDSDFRYSQCDIKELARIKWNAALTERTEPAKIIAATYKLGLPVADVSSTSRTETTPPKLFLGLGSVGLWIWGTHWLEKAITSEVPNISNRLSDYWQILITGITTSIPAGATDYWMPLANFLQWIAPMIGVPILAFMIDLFFHLIQGLGVFGLIVYLYKTPFLLLVHSTFRDDEPIVPTWSTLWPPRLLEFMFYYAGILSLSSVRRIVSLAIRPISWLFVLMLLVLSLLVPVLFPLAPFLSPIPLLLLLMYLIWSGLGPERLYLKVKIYFETELFFEPSEKSKAPKVRAGELLEKYASNLMSYDARTGPIVECNSCFDVLGNKNLAKIEDYFKAQLRVHREPKFLTKITFKSGYLAPAFLVSGPLSEYDEDWTKIVKAYPEKTHRNGERDPLKPLPDLRRLQSFIWDCWVQWGPSVPICNSDDWKSGEIALQFGYGDENNSMPLRCYSKHPDTGERTGHGFQKWQDKVKEIRSKLNPSDSPDNAWAWAWPVTVTGTLQWLGRGERNSKLCKAQNDTATEYSSEGWMVFDADKIEHNRGAPLYFSAYVWVLVAICRSTEALLDDTDADRAENAKHSRGYRLRESDQCDEWRCLIPYFQHGNIAEPSVYKSIKDELASKTVECLLNEVQKAKDLGVEWLHFAFVSAYDDNGDNRKSTNVASSETKKSIRELMDKKLKDRILECNPNRQSELRDLGNKIHLNEDALEELTACRLPHVVRTYLAHVEVENERVNKISKQENDTSKSQSPSGWMGRIWAAWRSKSIQQETLVSCAIPENQDEGSVWLERR